MANVGRSLMAHAMKLRKLFLSYLGEGFAGRVVVRLYGRAFGIDVRFQQDHIGFRIEELVA